MGRIQILSCIVFVGLLAGCSNPGKEAARAQKRSFDAQEDIVRQRLALVENYQTCIKEAAGNALQVEACDSYLRAKES